LGMYASGVGRLNAGDNEGLDTVNI
jgi:hypothetical protein